MVKEAKKPLYFREESKTWIMVLYDPLSRQRIRKSTKTGNYEEALRIYRRAVKDLETGIESITLGGVLDLYSNPETNPRYKIARIEGTHYGLDYAKGIAGRAKAIKKLLSTKTPAYISKDIRDLSKVDMKKIRQTLMESWGQRRKSHEAFSNLKTMLNQCAEDGYIQTSPGKEIRDIPYKEKKRPSFPAEIINKVLALRDLCPVKEYWAFFAVLATTGMRMSEALALTEKQIYKGTLTIDSALKSNGIDDIGLPKYDLVRIIPLSSITLEILSTIEPDKHGRFFHHNRSWGTRAIMAVQMVACGAYPLEKDIFGSMTSHTLRHSMNTNLLASGLPPLLVAEYLSWEHQYILDMQQRYTHVYAESLRPIADKIDELYHLPAAKDEKRVKKQA